MADQSLYPVNGQRLVRRSVLRRLISRREVTTLLAAVIIFIAFSVAGERFLTAANFIGIVRMISMWAIVAVGQTMLLISRELDISVGSLYAFLVVLLGVLVSRMGWDIWLGSFVVLLAGVAIGLFHGLLVTKIGIRSLIVTIATFAVFKGASIVLAGGYPMIVPIDSALFKTITGGRIFGVLPWMSAWMVLIVLVGAVVLAYTKFGYHIYAIGGNLQAARNTGINTDRLKIILFMITSTLVAVIAIITVGWSGNATFHTGKFLELQVFAVCIIGGTSMFGGRGTILGTLLGAFILGMIMKGLVYVGFGTYWDGVFIGTVILVVTSLETLIRRGGES